MHRTSVILPDELDRRLRLEARRRGVPLATVVRDAVEDHLARAEQPRRLSFVGIGEGAEDLSERVDELVAEAILERHSY